MPHARTVYLVDGSAQLHRAYFAVRGLANSRGLPTNAAFGFTHMLRKLVSEEQPEFLGIAFDLPEPTFRHQEYGEYKAHRLRMDEDLVVQIPYIRRVCEAFRIPVLECPGFEADDVIATLARQAVTQQYQVVVVSGDKDLLQLVDDQTLVLNPGREGTATRYDRQTVIEKFGVPPERVVDVLALVGDAVDNVPGVPGIGDKGARDLVREFGSLEDVLQNVDRVKRAAYRDGLRAHRDLALLSRRLVTLRFDAPVDLDLDALRRDPPDRAALHTLFRELEFASLAREFAPEVTVSSADYPVVTERTALEKVVSGIREAGQLAVSLIATSREAMRAEIVGFGLAWKPGTAVYVPLGDADARLSPGNVLETLAPVFADSRLAKLSARSKSDHVILGRCGVTYSGTAFDAILAAFLIQPGRREYELAELGYEYLGERVAGLPDLSGASVRPEAAPRAAASEADLIGRLKEPLDTRLREEGLAEIYQKIEIPLIEILADMEQTGVRVDAKQLALMSAEWEIQLTALVHEAHALAGMEFNLNSPAQLREVLFDRLGLAKGKKTAKTRAASTAEDVLEELAEIHPLPRKILEYRTLQKLKSTYVDALPALIHPETGRIHTVFHQTGAATGRLSSSDPNLQNIPIRTREGRRIREAFVPEDGFVLLSADYSQIELRILAHLSKDPTLIDTFRRGEDVHDRTSREVFGPFSPLPPEEQRRRSKMINYALLYGKTAFSLARDLGVSQKEAGAFIEAYFARYPSVKRSIDEAVARARQVGSVRTLLGRLRRLPDLHAKDFRIRMEAERQARNTPIQGSAADLIKKAMLDLHAELRRRSMRARLVLQIHDELLLEVPESEARQAQDVVKDVMEHALPLDVPLLVSTGIGKSWAEAH